MRGQSFVLGLCLLTSVQVLTVEGWFFGSSSEEEPEGCPGSPLVLTDASGSITSPNYPSKYDDDLRCAWKIQQPAGKRITLHFREFAVEQSPSCKYDVLTVYDGESTSAPATKLCGTGKPEDVTSTTHALYLGFRSDDSDSLGGFRIDYSTSDSPSAGSGTGSGAASTSGSSGGSCGGKAVVLTGTSGTVNSPGFPGSYGNNLDCAWRIQVTTGKVRLHFRKFAVEYNEQCKYDSLTVYDGSSTRASSSKLCGSGLPDDITSTGKALYLVFHTDDSNTLAGFQADYSSVQNPTAAPSGGGGGATSGDGGSTGGGGGATSGGGGGTSSGGEAGVNCDFEGGFCGWTQSRGDTFDWILGSGKTPSDYTGPSSDHTHGDLTSRYAYVEGSEPRVRGDTARLVSLRLRVGSSAGKCLRFFYHMNGQDMGRLRVYRQNQNGEEELLWHRDGDHGNFWHLARVDLSSSRGQFRVIIEAERGSNFDSDAAIDDVTVDDQACLAVPLDCGQTSRSRYARILGGSVSETGQWPWQVRIHVSIPGTQRYSQCGGAIISNQWILTASHCIEHNNQFIAEPTNMRVYFGDLNKANIEASEFSQTPARIIRHENREAGGRAYDILLVKLHAPLTWSDHVNAVCLPSPEDKLVVGTRCVVSGWGRQHHQIEESADDLMHVQLEILELSACASLYGSNKIRDGMLCAGSTSKPADACQGDSGGPLVCEMAGGRYVQAGVVSFGAPCGKYDVMRGVYTRVLSYTNWIQSAIQAN